MVQATTTEKAKVRKFLGFPGITSRHDLTSNVRPMASREGIALEKHLNDILDSDTYTLFQDFITKLDAIETKIVTAQGTSIAVDSVGKGEVVLNKKEVDRLWLEHYRWCEQLATLLGLEIRQHPLMKSGGIGNIPILV